MDFEAGTGRGPCEHAQCAYILCREPSTAPAALRAAELSSSFGSTEAVSHFPLSHPSQPQSSVTALLAAGLSFKALCKTKAGAHCSFSKVTPRVRRRVGLLGSWRSLSGGLLLLTPAFSPSYNFERPGLQFLSSAVSAEFWIFSSLLSHTYSNQFLPVV